eukprot:gene3927-4903_t
MIPLVKFLRLQADSTRFAPLDLSGVLVAGSVPGSVVILNLEYCVVRGKPLNEMIPESVTDLVIFNIINIGSISDWDIDRIPSKVKKLSMSGENYLRYLPHGILPSTITELELEDRNPVAKIEPELIPSSVKVLKFGSCCSPNLLYSRGSIPSTVEELHWIDFNHNLEIEEELKKLGEENDIEVSPSSYAPYYVITKKINPHNDQNFLIPSSVDVKRHFNMNDAQIVDTNFGIDRNIVAKVPPDPL